VTGCSTSLSTTATAAVALATGSGTIQYSLSAFLSPLNADGSSVFKYGSTIPVKIQILDCNNNPVPGLTPHIGWAIVDSATPPSGVNETASTSAADTTGIMRFSENQYIYNFATKTPLITDFNANYYFYVWDTAHQFAYKMIKWGLRQK